MGGPRVIVVRAAGINCDQETVRAWELSGARPERVHVNRLIERPALLSEYDVLTVPGGFSYGDDISAGKILASQFARHLAEDIARFLAAGKFVLGVCNGFQVLVKANLLPGTGPAGQVTIGPNSNGRFEDRWVRLRVDTSRCPFLERGEVLEMPVAHGEGRVIFASEEVRGRLGEADQIALRYVGPDGQPGAYPHNPNGSEDHVAGLVDPTGRVLGLMPHPERHIFDVQHPLWTRRPRREEPDGLRVFRRLSRLLSS